MYSGEREVQHYPLVRSCVEDLTDGPSSKKSCILPPYFYPDTFSNRGDFDELALEIDMAPDDSYSDNEEDYVYPDPEANQTAW